MKSVVEEEDRSRSFMLYGLKEETEEDISGKVCDVLLQLNLKPKVFSVQVFSLVGALSAKIKINPCSFQSTFPND